MLIGNADTEDLRSQSIGPGDPTGQGWYLGNRGDYHKPKNLDLEIYSDPDFRRWQHVRGGEFDVTVYVNLKMSFLSPHHPSPPLLKRR